MLHKLGTEKKCYRIINSLKSYQKLLEETEVCKHADNDKYWNILPYTERNEGTSQ